MITAIVWTVIGIAVGVVSTAAVSGMLDRILEKKNKKKSG